MALEVELKFPVSDFEALRSRLREAGAAPVSRVFERNAVFDDAERRLKTASTLLRLRTERKSVLTLKRPPDKEGDGVKVFEESETEVADPQAARAILEGLGYREAFAYEKLRETWRFGGCAVCLDRLPFGRFVEIEGEREAIFRTARELGLDLDSATTETYHALNRQAREQDGGKPSESFVFDPEQRARLQAAGAGDLAPPSTGNENGTILGKIKGNQ